MQSLSIELTSKSHAGQCHLTSRGRLRILRTCPTFVDGPRVRFECRDQVHSLKAPRISVRKLCTEHCVFYCPRGRGLIGERYCRKNWTGWTSKEINRKRSRIHRTSSNPRRQWLVPLSLEPSQEIFGWILLFWTDLLSICIKRTFSQWACPQPVDYRTLPSERSFVSSVYQAGFIIDATRCP